MRQTIAICLGTAVCLCACGIAATGPGTNVCTLMGCTDTVTVTLLDITVLAPGPTDSETHLRICIDDRCAESRVDSSSSPLTFTKVPGDYAIEPGDRSWAFQFRAAWGALSGANPHVATASLANRLKTPDGSVYNVPIADWSGSVDLSEYFPNGKGCDDAACHSGSASLRMIK